MNKYKIMIVDDEPDILELLEKSLAIEGFQNITKIDNGLSAVNSCRTLQPDMIILDVMLPGIDGYEVWKEIAYRVKAQLRRTEYRQLPTKAQLLKVGALSIDPEGCRVTKDGKGIELTAREFEILHYMAQNIGRVISKERLYETVWGEDGFGCDNTIMVHIRHLREKIESNPTSPEYIITMKGLGYKLVKPYEK